MSAAEPTSVSYAAAKRVRSMEEVAKTARITARTEAQATFFPELGESHIRDTVPSSAYGVETAQMPIPDAKGRFAVNHYEDKKPFESPYRDDDVPRLAGPFVVDTTTFKARVLKDQAGGDIEPSFEPQLQSNPDIRDAVQSSRYGVERVELPEPRAGPADELTFTPEVGSCQLREAATSSGYGKNIPTVEPADGAKYLPTFTPTLESDPDLRKSAPSANYGREIPAPPPQPEPENPKFQPELPDCEVRKAAASSGYGVYIPVVPHFTSLQKSAGKPEFILDGTRHFNDQINLRPPLMHTLANDGRFHVYSASERPDPASGELDAINDGTF